MLSKKIFKTNDLRGAWGKEWDKEGVARIAEAFKTVFNPVVVAIGRDLRPSSIEIFKVLSERLVDLGVEVWDLGEITTDISYLVADKWPVSLTIMVTASHNSLADNGLKCTLPTGTIIFDSEKGEEFKNFVFSEKKPSEAAKKGKILVKDPIWDYKETVLSVVEAEKIKPLRVAVDVGHGVAGKVLLEVVAGLPIEVLKINFDSRRSLNDQPINPLVPETLIGVEKEVVRLKADFGASFDSDGDRMAIICNQGKLVSASAMTALFAEHLLKKNPGGSVGYNAICGRIVPKVIKGAGGVPVRTKVGHALVKETMKEKKLIFAGEHSYHFYFSELGGADSGIAAFLIFAEIVSRRQEKTSEICQLFNIYPQSGELNFEVDDKNKTIEAVGQEFIKEAESVDYLDGISAWFDDWWFNLRPSGTQPLVRLNIEADNDKILAEKEALLTDFILKHSDHGGNS